VVEETRNVDELFDDAQQALDGGNVARARTLLEEAYRRAPEHDGVRGLRIHLLTAEGVRLAERAREMRRRFLAGLPRDATSFDDPPEVRDAWREALDRFDEVLRMRPLDVKGVMMKASTLFRMDRDVYRKEAVALLRRGLEAHPEAKQIAIGLRKIEEPCPQCGDVGFCSKCDGRGFRRTLGVERRCGACWGKGVCMRCGIV
jgi:predicted Zn-dependent protease